MVRKLAFVMVWLAATLPGLVQALGLGEIQLNSFLNQPLRAQIDVISSKRGEADGLRINLAPPEAFERLGLEYSDVLRTLKFKLVQKNGRYFIDVTTRAGYREPFLNFLIEVNWAGGRVLREYAALVDPPSLVRSSGVKTQSTVSQTSSAASAPAKQTKAPLPPLYGSQESEQSASTGGFVGDTYRTQRRDTAWKIAKQVVPDGQVSVEQAMMAILRANPNAFIKQNVNRLKAGYDLDIPDRDSMVSMSRSQALAELRQQTSEWRNRGRSSSTASSGRLEILPPKKDSSGSSSASGASGGNGESHREAMLAREAAEAQRQENSELRLRLSEQQELIENSRRELQLKSQRLAELERKLAQAGKEPEVAPEPVPETPVIPEVPATPTPDVAMEPEQPEVPVVEVPKTPKVVVEAVPAAPGSPVNQHVVTGFEPVDLTKLPKTGLPAKPFKTEPAATSKPAMKETGIMDEVMGFVDSNPMIAYIVGGVVGLVVLILIVMGIRKRRGEDQFEESILQSHGSGFPAFDQEPEGTDENRTEKFFETVDVDETIRATPDVAAAADEDDTIDTAFLSDMVMSDMSELEAEGGESDPLTEADVFLAYGRFGPAENMIKGAIANEPERNDLRLKLLEIYYSAKNKDMFESESAVFHEDLLNKPDAETWSKVVEMGNDLCPGNSLFSDGDVTRIAAVEDNVQELAEEDTDLMDFDLGEFEEQLDSLGADVEPEPIVESDDGLDLDLDDLMGTTSDDPTMEITTELEGIADVLNEDVEKGNEVTQELDALLDITEDEPTQEFDKPDLSGVDSTLEFDADQGDEATLEFDAPTGTNEITQEIEVPDLASEFDLGDTAEATATMTVDSSDIDLDEGALADIDEVGTKLDLARAYIDMGDPEGARSILDEVVEEGNDSQKSEAEELISQIK